MRFSIGLGITPTVLFLLRVLEGLVPLDYLLVLNRLDQLGR
jgi:hypothetical protein